MTKPWEAILEALKSRGHDETAIRFVLEMIDNSKIVVETTTHPSDIVNPLFNTRFIASFIIHHTINQHRLDKKAFEYSFRDALRATARKAELDPSDTNPGADIAVDDVPMSLKTEGSKGIRLDRIVISKLMESAWMKPYKSLGEFHASIAKQILPHFKKYDRMFMLRVFPIENGQHYVLVEIPMEVLRSVKDVKKKDLSPLTKAKGTSAVVRWKGKTAWTLRFDGSDDKITLTDLPTSLCRVHGEWKVKWAAQGTEPSAASVKRVVQEDLT